MADDTDLQTACNSLWKTREDILDCIKYELDLMNSFSSRMVAKLYFNKIALDKNVISSAFNKGLEDESLNVKLARINNIICRKIDEEILKEEQESRRVAETYELLLNVSKFVFDKSANFSEISIKSLEGDRSTIAMNSQPIENNAEALRRKLLWELWSGNKPLPEPQLFRFLKAHETTSSGPVISIPFKPVVWQRVLQHKSSESVQSVNKAESTGDDASYRKGQDSKPRQLEKLLSTNNQFYKQMDIASSEESEYCKNLSFGDFLAAIPNLCLLSGGSLKALESAATQYVIPPSSEILIRGQRTNDVYFVRRGVVNVSRPSVLNPLLEETVQYLGWGDLICNVILLPDGSRSDDRDTTVTSSNYSYAAGYAEVTVYVVPQETFVQIIMDEISGENSAVNAVSKAKKYLMIQNDLLNRSNRSDVAASEFYLNAHMKLFSHVLQSLAVLETGSAGESRVPVRSVMAVLLKLTGPELDFEEVVDELLQQCKLALQVDRVGLYVVDKILSTMILYVSQNVSRGDNNSATNSPSSVRLSMGKSPSSPGSTSSTNTKRSNGIRMPLKGVAAHVAVHGTPLVIADAYQNKHFDPSMDLRTGYRTKQMLSVPVYNHMGETVSVLQFINTLDGRLFSSHDVLIADLICRLLSTKAYLMKVRALLNGYKSLNKANEKFRIQVLSAVTDKPHRHLKLLTSLYVGTQQYGVTHRSELFPTVPFNADSFGVDATGFEGADNQLKSRISRCNFNTEVAFTSNIAGGVKDVELANLPQSGRIIIELFSKNNHPVSWTSIHMFDFDRTFRSGAIEAILMDGPRPASILDCVSACCELNQGKVSQSERSFDVETSILSVAFPSFDAVNVVRDFDLSARYYNAVQVPHNTLTGSGLNINSVEWYLLHMTAAEKKKYIHVVDLYAYQLLFPGTDIDTETAQLIWRMRLALSVECTWALPLFLLSVDWLNADAVEETYRLLYSWTRPSAAEVLQLLDGRFQDSRVRAYAVTVLSRVSDVQLLNVLFQLIYLLRFEPYSDSSLIRFIFRRAVGNPTCIGRKCCLYLLNTYAQDPVKNRTYGSLLNLLLRSLPYSDRVHLMHGWYFFRKVDEAFRDGNADYMLVSAAATGGTASSIFSRKKTPDRRKPPKSAVDSMIDRMIAARIPPVFCTSLSSRLCVGVEKYMAIVDDGKKKTFSISLSVEKPVSKSDKMRIIYSQDIDSNLEVLYGQLLRAIEFVWEEEAVDIGACAYESCVLDHNDAVFIEQPNDTATLNTLIVKALFPDNKSGNSAAKASQNNASKKIPESLLLEYFSAKNVDEGSFSGAIDNFKRSLAAFLVVTYVLSIFGVSASNTAVTGDGRIYLKSPEYILGLESVTSAVKKKKWKRNKEALFYLPCFARVFGNDDSVHHSEFHHLLSAAFLSVRKHSAYIVASIINLFELMHYSEDEQKFALQLLKETLSPNVDDATALLKFMENVNRGLNLDYQINVS